MKLHRVNSITFPFFIFYHHLFLHARLFKYSISNKKSTAKYLFLVIKSPKKHVPQCTQPNSLLSSAAILVIFPLSPHEPVIQQQVHIHINPHNPHQSDLQLLGGSLPQPRFLRTLPRHLLERLHRISGHQHK